jgi:hypothetical protein
MTEAERRCTGLLMAGHELNLAGMHDLPVYDTLMDYAEVVWDNLTDEEKVRVRKLSSDLNKKEREARNAPRDQNNEGTSNPT